MPDHELGAEDEKIVLLARSARARNGANEGAAVRDTDGRTYSATTIDLPSFQLTALQAAVAAAVSSGADGLEAAAVVSPEPGFREQSVHAVRDVSANVPIFRADPSGTVLEVLR
ncbi:cytidine deaminase [Amycolatopsis magusensis]|uniref:cytidine deaminase n=1 Tax=Amycolatopsis magusensis TaxID=882444 RepID=UPI003C2FA427